MVGKSVVRKKNLDIHLDRTEETDQLREEIENAILVIDESAGKYGHIDQVRRELARRFGGTAANYPDWRVTNGSYVIRLPAGMDFNVVANSMSVWAIRNDWCFFRYDPDGGAIDHCERFRIRVKIQNLPFERWTEGHIRQIISAFGTCLQIDHDNLFGKDRRHLLAWINSDDPRNIPKRITVKYGRKKKICRVVVVNWEYDTSVPMSVKDGKNWDKHDGWSSDDDIQEDRQDKQMRIRVIGAHDRLERRSEDMSSSESSSSEPSDSGEVEKYTAPRPMYIDAPSKIVADSNGPYGPGAASLVNKDDGMSCVVDSSVFQRSQRSCKEQKNASGREEKNKWGAVWDYLGLDIKSKKSDIARLEPAKANKEGPGELQLRKLKDGVHGSNGENRRVKEDSSDTRTIEYLEGSNNKNCLLTSHQLNQGTNMELTRSLFGNKRCSLKDYSGFAVVKSYHPPTSSFSLSKNSSFKNSLLQAMDDQQLLQSFLQKMKIEDDQAKVFHVPSKFMPATNWNRCLLVKVLTEDLVHENRFTTRIKKDMRVQPGTRVQAQGKNVFLIEFVTETDMYRVIEKGAWDFNGEVMAVKRVFSMEQVANAEFDTIDAWVQVHGIPPCALLVEGIPAMLSKVGTPLSDAVCFFYNRRKAYKVKLSIPLNKVLLDTIVMENKDQGLSYEVYLVYENIKKVCFFCGFIGHLKEECKDRMIMMRLRSNPNFKNVEELWNVQDKVKVWVNDISEVPVFKEDVVFENRKGDVFTAGTTSGGDVIRDESRGIVEFTTIPGGTKRSAAGDLRVEMTQQEDSRSEVSLIQPLNFKRAREANPNSPPSAQ